MSVGLQQPVLLHVTVEDNEVPTITVQQIKQQIQMQEICTAEVTVVAPTTDDNCGAASRN